MFYVPNLVDVCFMLLLSCCACVFLFYLYGNLYFLFALIVMYVYFILLVMNAYFIYFACNACVHFTLLLLCL